MSVLKLCEGRWDEISSWEFFLSDELPPIALCVAASCVGIMEPSGDVVLSRTHRGWSTLGGHIEDNETPEQTMRREALEEGGFRVERQQLLGFRKVTNSKQLFSKQTGKPYPPVSYIPWYIAVSTLPLVPTSGDEGEIFEAKEFTLEQARLLNLQDQPLIDAAFKLYKNYKKA